MRLIYAVLFVLALPLLPLSWLFCRLVAERCPVCRSRWWTERYGEWDGEFWSCHRCGHYWEVRRS